MPPDNYMELIANRLKSYRQSRKMSLDATAAATSVSKAMLGQIERRESAPTIATLWKIARGLHISFSSFFADETLTPSSQTLFPNDPDMRVRVLFPYDTATRMELFEVTLKNNHHQRSPAHQVGVVEHVVVLEGALGLLYEETWRELAPGEGVRFHADVAHEYRAVTATAVFHNIICYT